MGRRRQSIVAAAFFCSGAAGLVYQVVWSRLLNEVFGISAYATTAVLATYLGGLALGGWALGPAADRAARPLRLYGLLELGVAATALAGAWLVPAVEPADAWAAARLPPDALALLGLRVLLASAVVLPPTFLMGATLPVMTRAWVDRIDRIGRTLALLYALNTAGAVAGSLAAGFVLVRALGVHAALWVAVATNLLVGVLALALSRGAPAAATAAAAARPAPAAGPPAPPIPRGPRWLLVAMALSGFASLSLEVLWTRMLVLVLGTSTYAFATMLTTFLVGIAAGSWAARRRVDRLARPRAAFGWLQLAIAATTLASLPLVRRAVADGPRWMAALGARGAGAGTARFALSFAVMIVPTALIGATFPLAARLWARALDRLGASLGQVYGANSLGNVVGALAGGFVLLPAFGVQRGIALLVLANLAAASLALLPPREAWRRPRALAPALPAFAALWGCAALLGAWHPSPLPASAGDPQDPLRFYREGLVSTVSVFQRASDGRQLVMRVDGVTIGQSVEGVDHKQQFLAHAPFLLAQAPLRRVLSVGLGTGILAGEVARHPGVERVDCVELSPTVIEAARLFEPLDGGVLADPRVRVVNDDAVRFLRQSGARWDAIVSDGKSISGHAGNAVFYSEDYYRSARAHLAPGGVMIQWVPLDVTAEDLRTIVRTFAAGFPHAYLWLGTGSSFLVGLQRPLALDLARVQAELEAPAAAGLRRHGWRDAADVAGFLLADGPSLAAWAGAGPRNSLERPILEFHALDDAPPAPERVAANLGALAALRRLGAADVAVTGAGEAAAAVARAVGPLLEGLARASRDDPGAAARLEEALAAAPAASGEVRRQAADALFELARSLDLRGRLAEAEALYLDATRAWPELPEAWVNLGRIAGLEGRADDARARLERALALNPLSGSAHAMLGRLLELRGDAAGAVAHLRVAVRLAPLAAELHEDLGLSLALTRRTGDALEEFRAALRLAPDWPAALERVALLLATDREPRRRDPAEAIRLADRAVALTGGGDPQALEVEAAALAAAGRFGEAQGAEEKVLALAATAGDGALAGAARETLELYRRRLPLPPEDAPAP